MRTGMVLVFAAAALVLVTGAACGGEDSGRGSGQREVAASFYPLGWAAQRVGGGTVEVWNVTPPGAEPHDVELSARDVQRIRDADLVLYLGEGFQPSFERAAHGADGEVVDLLAGLRLEPGSGDRHGGEHGDEHEEPPDSEGAAELDPHVWLDPLRFAAVVHRLGVALDRPDAAAGLVRDLRRLHGEFARGLARCARRQIVTSHAAFGYLARRYGLRQIALTGISPEAEVSAHDLEDVVAEVREHGATTIFFETLVSPRLAQTVAREAGAETAVLNPLEGLSEDELAGGEDYVSIMRTNLAALRGALACR